MNDAAIAACSERAAAAGTVWRSSALFLPPAVNQGVQVFDVDQGAPKNPTARPALVLSHGARPRHSHERHVSGRDQFLDRPVAQPEMPGGLFDAQWARLDGARNGWRIRCALQSP